MRSYRAYYYTYIIVSDYNDAPQVKPSYKWEGTTIVKKRIVGLSGSIFGIDGFGQV
jgi:hypothetical protein